MRLEPREPGGAFAPLAVASERWDRDDVFAEDASVCDCSFLGTSSGQYHPGIGWKPEDEDMAGFGGYTINAGR